MANDLKLQEGQCPVDSHLRPIKVGGETTALELSKDDVRVNNLHVNGTTSGVSASDSTKLPLAGGTMTGDITTDSNIVSTNLTIDDSGTITLDSHTGVFIASKAGTEFSAANSAYAGMILGYTRIANDGTGSLDAFISMDGTLTVLQTGSGTNLSIGFTAPPSGNVEITMDCLVYASSKTVEFALSDNATYNEIDETHTYDYGTQSSDETDQNMTTVIWAVTGLTAGTSYTYYIAGAETVSGITNIRHGRYRSTGMHYPPIIIKAVALPATITTGE